MKEIHASKIVSLSYLCYHPHGVDQDEVTVWKLNAELDV